MAPVANKPRSRAKQFAFLDEKPVKDFDPEADGPADDGASNGSDEEEEDVAGTEHYVSVGKSKLRQKEAPALGPKYSGVRVSRAALDDSSDGESGQEDGESDDDDDASGEDGSEEEFDDPDLADLERDNIIDDEEIDSDDALAEGEEEMFKKKGFTFKDSKSNAKKAASSSSDKKAKALANERPRRMVAADLMSGSESEEEEATMNDGLDDSEEDVGDSGSEEDATDAEEGPSDEDESNEDDESEEDDEEEEDDDDEEDEDEEMDDADATNDRSSLRNLVQDDQKGVIFNISQAAKADAEKGVAVRQQRRSYDSLLNLRIRLQKGLVAINSLNQATDSDDDDDDKQPYEAAEEAAIKLWNAIDRFRASLLPEPKAGQKRKRDTQTIDSSLDEIWEDMQADEERATAKRNKILAKWSNKVKSTTATVSKQRHLGATASDSLIGALETQLLNPERLIKRTQVPRSCAPLQASKKVAEDTTIYDDADFYQLLLKELVDQRTNDAGGDADGNVPTVRWTAVKEAKTRKQVDRRASKGRKLRFTVHEKLQNFMAPEVRKSWEEEAIDRLFGTLFGQRMQLKEDVSDEEEDDMVLAEEGLKLFRN